MGITGTANKQHRTALVIDAAKEDVSSTFRERVARLLASLNGNNIKVDVYNLRNGVVTPRSASATLPQSASVPGDVVAWGKSQGYDQTIFSG